MHDLPDWAQYDDVVQRALAQLRLPYDDPGKSAALYLIGSRACELRDFDTAVRAFDLAHAEFARMREPGLLDRVRGRTPAPPEMLRRTERATYGLRAHALLFLDRPYEALESLDHADTLPVPDDDDIVRLVPRWRGWAALSLDRPATAEELLEEVLAQPGVSADAVASEQARLSLARLLLGSADGAVVAMAELERVLREQSRWADLASWSVAVVDAHLAERSLSGARAAVGRIEADTGSVTSRDALRLSQATAHVAVVLAATGEDDEALRWSRRAVELSRYAPVEVLGPALYRGVQLLVTARWQRHLSTRRLARVMRGTAWWADALVVEAHQASLQAVCESMLDVVSRDTAYASQVQEAAKLALLEGREDDAVSLLRAAEGLALRDGGDTVGVAHDLASVHVLAGRDEDARSLLEPALDLVTDDSFEQAGLLHELAALHARAGRSRLATDLYDRAAPLHLELEHRPDYDDCIANLAVLRGEPVPASFAPFRSGLFEMLWG